MNIRSWNFEPPDEMLNSSPETADDGDDRGVEEAELFNEISAQINIQL